MRPNRSLVDVIGHGNQRVATSLRCRDRHLRAPTHSKPRKAVAMVNQTIDELRVAQHPDKTFIGRISRGFDFLGYPIAPEKLSIAANTILNFINRICQLYEQGADSLRIGQYVKRWTCWATAGLPAFDAELVRVDSVQLDESATLPKRAIASESLLKQRFQPTKASMLLALG